MTSLSHRVFTIAPEEPFLEVLAQAVLKGFPRDDGRAPDPLSELPRWTILLPTRRAVRELERIFLSLSGGRGTLLPRIKPLGDIDEDLLTPDEPGLLSTAIDLPDAISPIGRELVLIALIDEWAAANPQSRLAQEISASPQQAHALAISLAEFTDGLETEEIDGSRIPELFGLESARHREAILDFLALARVRLPSLLRDWNLIGRKERQSRLLRHEARRLRSQPPAWPIVAAGSTGSIPATRELLKSISMLPAGALVLPGLDTALDEKSWQAVGPQHPQYALKQLLADLAISHAEVAPLSGLPPGPRSWLARELMRPPDTSEAWRDTLSQGRNLVKAGFSNIELVETAHRQEEALVIALMLREALETPGRTASLITPDRDLARRVKQELRRWHIDIDDSAGEPLIGFGGAALTGLVMDTVVSDFSAESLNSLFKHHLCNFGLDPIAARKAARTVELALFRSGTGIPDLEGLASAIKIARGEIKEDRHANPAAARLTDKDWSGASQFITMAVEILGTLSNRPDSLFKDHVAAIIACCEAVAGPGLWDSEPGQTLRTLLDAIGADAHRLERCSLASAIGILRHHLTMTPYRPVRSLHPRLSILGLLEARLVRADLHVLGGLNEGVWPAFPDSGPWLNRPMRDILGLQQPERSIGQTAHDFVQAFGSPEVRLVWSRRIGDSPVIPSRWILRLRMLLSSSDDPEQPGAQSPWPDLARRLDEAEAVRPCLKPRPTPAIEARPKRLSVTQIETLIRDPYEIYARHVLRLEPLDPITTRPDPSLRGTLIHAALGDFFRMSRHHLPPHALELLLEEGRRHFQPHMDKALISGFWWPRFRRIAEWIVAEELGRRAPIRETHAEIAGALEMSIGSGSFTLSCRADRIDVLVSGEARIIDYKTGAVPSMAQVKSGLSPQLTLEAAMLELGAFPGVGRITTGELAYTKLGGGEPPGETTRLKLDDPPMECARRHLAGLIELLATYMNPTQPYLPRTIVKTQDEDRAYDHLSRYREWALSGDAR